MTMNVGINLVKTDHVKDKIQEPTQKLSNIYFYIFQVHIGEVDLVDSGGFRVKEIHRYQHIIIGVWTQETETVITCLTVVQDLHGK